MRLGGHENMDDMQGVSVFCADSMCDVLIDTCLRPSYFYIPWVADLPIVSLN
jgi:hypothetical protein